MIAVRKMSLWDTKHSYSGVKIPSYTSLDYTLKLHSMSFHLLWTFPNMIFGTNVEWLSFLQSKIAILQTYNYRALYGPKYSIDTKHCTFPLQQMSPLYQYNSQSNLPESNITTTFRFLKIKWPLFWSYSRNGWAGPQEKFLWGQLE